MTANANDIQSSERESLAIDLMEYSLGDKSVFSAAAAQLRADEAEIAQLNRLVELRSNEAVDNLDEAIRLRAENEALRTAGDELMEACKQRDNALIDRTMSRRLALDTVDLDAIHEAVAAASRRYNAALQSFIRSKESRRG